MNMTFDDYIKNPQGKGNSVISNREMYRNLYNDKLDKISARELGKVNYTLYKDGDSRYLIHFKIPSEVVAQFYYDTVIEFYTSDPIQRLSRSIKGYNVKFYSNDPSFVYTFAHAFLVNQVFIKDLVPRMSKEAVKKLATEKNPGNQVGYVKSIYFAYILANRYSLFDKIQFETYGKKYSKTEILKNVEHADKKLIDRQVEGAKQVEKNKKQKREVKDLRNRELSRTKHNPDMVVSQTSRTSNVKSAVKTAKTGVTYAKRAKRV